MLEGTRIILFDAVGTIVTPRPSFAEVYLAAGQRFGSRRTRLEIQDRFGEALRKTYQLDADPLGADQIGSDQRGTAPIDVSSLAANLSRSPTSESIEHQRWRQIVGHVFDDAIANIDDLFAHLWRHFSEAENWALYPDVVPTLEALESRQVRWGIASNFDARLEGICSRLPLLRNTRELFYSSSLGYSKPDPRFFHEAARRLGLAPHEISLIGDDPINDLEGASRAGWKVWRIDRTATERVDRCLNSLTEILDMLPSRLEQSGQRSDD